ncbi:MAG: DNA adenine methylase [Polyangiales bacterium]
MIKYIGSKRVLVPAIVAAVQALPGVRRVLDLFSGTSRVAYALRQAGLEVTANDHNRYAHVLAQCYVEAERRQHLVEAERLIRELQALPPKAGYFTETFCVRSRYLQPDNGAKVDAMRAQIAAWSLEPVLEAVLLTSLMEAADRVDSTCGLQMAYLKQWSARSYKPIELRLPALLDGPGAARCAEAEALAGEQAWDLVYLDPPYNQHKYRNNYHVWESLVRWDKPKVYGVACKRIDCRDYKSAFNRKREIAAALRRVLASLKTRYILLSFNNEGYLAQEALEAMLRPLGELTIERLSHSRYIGAQIGIFNPQGERVGKVSHVRNEELLFRVRCHGAAVATRFA